MDHPVEPPSGPGKGKLKRLWNVLEDPASYRIPRSPEEFQSLFTKSFFQLGHRFVYLTDAAAEALRLFADGLLQHAGRGRFSYSFIWKIARDHIKGLLEDPDRASGTFEVHLAAMVNEINAGYRSWTYIRRIEGIKMDGFREIAAGSWRIFAPADDDVDRIVARVPTSSGKWPQQARDFLEMRFRGKLCFTALVEGDQQHAQERAVRLGQFVVDTFRFAIALGCALQNNPRRYKADGAQVALAGSPQDGWHDALVQDAESGEVTISGGSDESRQPLVIREPDLERFRKDMHLDLLWTLGERSDRSELESVVVEAVRWIGDAQAEPRIGSALIKYWTALEVLLTGFAEQDIARRLREHVPIIVAQFTGIASPSRNQVRRLYDHRSDVIHGRLPRETARTDLHTVASWAAVCTCFYLELSTRGYETREHVEEQCARLAQERKQP